MNPIYNFMPHFGSHLTRLFLLQVFLTKHYRNRRLGDLEFVLDFEEIYVIDSKTKSITRARVVVRSSDDFESIVCLFCSFLHILLNESYCDGA